MGENSRRAEGCDRKPSVDIRDYAYLGETDAHQCLEHVYRALNTLVEMLVNGFTPARCETCQFHTAQALEWSTTADIATMDVPDRQMIRARLTVLQQVGDTWEVSHQGDPYVDSVSAALGAVSDILLRVYLEREHFGRLVDLGRITVADLEQENTPLLSGTPGWAEIQDEEVLTRDALQTYLREFDAAIVALSAV